MGGHGEKNPASASHDPDDSFEFENYTQKSQAQPKGELQISPPRKLSNLPQLRRTKEVLQHGGFIPVFIILRGTFRRISQLWGNAHK